MLLNCVWCFMPTGDENVVVDERLRVRGVNFLRVADASVVPTIPNGNVHSTVLLIASRAADMLLEDQDQMWRNVTRT